MEAHIAISGRYLMATSKQEDVLRVTKLVGDQ